MVTVLFNSYCSADNDETIQTEDRISKEFEEGNKEFEEEEPLLVGDDASSSSPIPSATSTIHESRLNRFLVSKN